MRLRPFWATYISTSKLGIPSLVSFCDTILLALQAWAVSLAYLFSFLNDRTANLRDRPILRVLPTMDNRKTPAKLRGKRLNWNFYQSMVLVRMTRRERYSNTGVQLYLQLIHWSGGDRRLRPVSFGSRSASNSCNKSVLRTHFFSCCKRSSLSPHVVAKVFFVHENGHLLEDV